jgi:hypothetical protein
MIKVHSLGALVVAVGLVATSLGFAQATSHLLANAKHG